jgi:hypothetical protein
VHGAVLLIVRVGGVVTEYDGNTAAAWLLEAKVRAGSPQPKAISRVPHDHPSSPLIPPRPRTPTPTPAS